MYCISPSESFLDDEMPTIFSLLSVKHLDEHAAWLIKQILLIVSIFPISFVFFNHLLV